MFKQPKQKIIVLCISGFDTSNFSGNSADMRTCYRLNIRPMSILTAITAQNMDGVLDIYATSETSLQKQLQAILQEYSIQAVKIGMVYQAKFFSIIARFIEEYSLQNVVYDPVLYSTSKSKLFQNSEHTFTNSIFAFAKYTHCITPNIPEAEKLIGMRIQNKQDITNSLEKLHKKGFANVIIKGGHTISKSNVITDYFSNGTTIAKKSYKKLICKHTRASGCVFSTALACYLAKSYSMKRSFFYAKKCTWQYLKSCNK